MSVLRHSTLSYSPGKEKKNGMNSVACISGGSYRFSFKFIIPDKYLPTSFEGRHGNIRYWARAVIERGLGKSDIKTKPAQFLIGDYVALEDFEHVSVSMISVLCCIIEQLRSSSSAICLDLLNTTRFISKIENSTSKIYNKSSWRKLGKFTQSNLNTLYFPNREAIGFKIVYLKQKIRQIYQNNLKVKGAGRN